MAGRTHQEAVQNFRIPLQQALSCVTREVLYIRFSRSVEPGMAGFVEAGGAVRYPKSGWGINVITTHEGKRDVADIVKAVLKR
jgi:hypothetical protein